MQKIAPYNSNYAKNNSLNSKEGIIFVRKNFLKEDLNNFFKIGILNNEQIKVLNTNTNIIKLSIDSMIKNILEHPDLSIDDYYMLNKILENPDKFIQDRKNNLRIFKNINGKFYEIIIKTIQTKTENFLTTYHRCDKAKLRNKKR